MSKQIEHIEKIINAKINRNEEELNFVKLNLKQCNDPSLAQMYGNKATRHGIELELLNQLKEIVEQAKRLKD